MIAIKDMEMPSSCVSCDIRSGNFCYAKNKPPYNIKGSLLTRDDDCPLVEIDEHRVDKLKKIEQILEEMDPLNTITRIREVLDKE